ncbi:MAG: hypothetical protein HC880_15050 [Bacteroidia bacterium]|nr:hypothetical protein [Bacteroidia bacterium]
MPGKLREILEEAQNWQDKPHQKGQAFYGLWDAKRQHFHSLHQHTFSEIAGRFLQDQDKTHKYLVINHAAIDIARNTIPVLKMILPRPKGRNWC